MNFSRNNNPSSNKFKIEMMMIKIREYYNLQKERKTNQVVREEKQIIQLLNSQNRSKLEETLAFEKIVNSLRYLNALRYLISYSEIIKANSGVLALPLNYQRELFQLLPYIMGIIYSSEPTSLKCINDFRINMEEIFGQENLRLTYFEGNLIPIQLRRCFQPFQPSFKEINQYVVQMCQRNDFDIQFINSIGHNFYPQISSITSVQPKTFQNKSKPPPSSPSQSAKFNLPSQISSHDLNKNNEKSSNKESSLNSSVHFGSGLINPFGIGGSYMPTYGSNIQIVNVKQNFNPNNYLVPSRMSSQNKISTSSFLFPMTTSYFLTSQIQSKAERI